MSEKKKRVEVAVAATVFTDCERHTVRKVDVTVVVAPSEKEEKVRVNVNASETYLEVSIE